MSNIRYQQPGDLNVPRDPDQAGQPVGLPDGPRPGTVSDQPDGGAPPLHRDPATDDPLEDDET